MAHVAQYKKDIVAKLEKLMLDYPIIGAVNMESLPAPQLQKMREQLRGKVELFMTKRRLMKIAIEKVKDKKPGIEKLEEKLRGMPALIFTKDNPFALFKTLKKSKSNAPAKAGQTAPNDIEVKAGPTSFAPGPIIGELGGLGIKCGVEDGKIAIKEDSIVAKEGDKISQKLAEILTRLGIEPMEVGLDLIATYENGTIFGKDVLDIDEEAFKADLNSAVSGAMNLALNVGYPTKETIKILIGKAFNDAKVLGLEQNIIDEGVIDELVGKAERHANGVKSAGNISVPDKAEEKKDEPKKEEAPKAEEKPKEELEKKEEKVLKEEKEIIKEEQKLEKEATKADTPEEKEVKEAVKEEEEKQLEAERIDKEKEVEKIEEAKPKDKSTEDKVAEMVEATKKQDEKKPSADELVEEAKEEDKPKEKDVPSASELAAKKVEEHKSAEELTQELIKKGTLRK